MRASFDANAGSGPQVIKTKRNSSKMTESDENTEWQFETMNGLNQFCVSVRGTNEAGVKKLATKIKNLNLTHRLAKESLKNFVGGTWCAMLFFVRVGDATFKLPRKSAGQPKNLPSQTEMDPSWDCELV